MNMFSSAVFFKRGDPERNESFARQTIRATKRACNLALAVLREIFDESAYARFLDRHQLESSRCSYAAFRHEHEHTKACRPRCC